MVNIGDDRSQTVQPMHTLDVALEIRREIPSGTEVFAKSERFDGWAQPVVNDDVTRRRRWDFVPVERGVAPGDDRPGLYVPGRFAGEIAGIELGDGGRRSRRRQYEITATIRSSALIPAMVSISVRNASGPSSRPEKPRRARARRLPRVAMGVDVTFVVHSSANARSFAFSASRPTKTPEPTIRRRSSLKKLSARTCGMASQSPAAK